MSVSALKEAWVDTFESKPVYISHRNDGNRREAANQVIEVFQAHALGADVVENLTRFYAEALRGIVLQATFWYKSRGNVLKRSAKENADLAALVRTRKEKLLILAEEVGASIVPFGELDLLTDDEQELFAEIEVETKKYGTDFILGIAAGYSRTPFSIRATIEMTQKDPGFITLTTEEQVDRVFSKMHKGLKAPNIYVSTGSGHGNKTSDGFHDPDESHIFFTDTLWPQMTCDIAQEAIMQMFTHHKIKLGK